MMEDAKMNCTTMDAHHHTAEEARDLGHICRAEYEGAVRIWAILQPHIDIKACSAPHQIHLMELARAAQSVLREAKD